MAKEKKGGGKSNRKLGRDKVRCNLYRVRHVREKHKLKHVWLSSGLNQARAYAALHSLTRELDALIARQNQSHD